MTELTRYPLSTTLVDRVDITVISRGNPGPTLLRHARVKIQTSKDLQEVFSQARKEGVSGEVLSARLAPALTPLFPGEEGIEGLAQYLADEYTQIGDSLLLVSSDTGRAIAKLTDDDFYQPAPVARESGNMATPAKRLRPELEGFIVQWAFDRGAEQKDAAHFLSKVTQTQLLKEEGDPRLHFSTKRGRDKLVKDLEKELPRLFTMTTGYVERWITHSVTFDSPPEGSTAVSLGYSAHFGSLVIPMMDKRAKNIQHHIFGQALKTLANSWVRSLVTQVSVASGESNCLAKNWAVTRDDTYQQRCALFDFIHEPKIWACDPDVCLFIRKQTMREESLATPMKKGLGLGFNEGSLYLKINPESYKIKNRELFDRWEIAATFEGELWVDWSKLHILHVEDIESTGASVEVVV